MSDFDRWLTPVTQRRLAEFEEMLVVTFQSPGPPHHILSFCHNCVGGEPPQQVAKEFASLGREVPLSKVAQIFLDRYSGDLIDKKRLYRLMRPLSARLQQTLDKATAADVNWRSSNAHRLELHGTRLCGETSFEDYDSGNLLGRFAAWNARAASLIRRENPQGKTETRDILLSGKLAPFEAIAYVMRTLSSCTYAEMTTHASATLRQLAEKAEARYLAAKRPEAVDVDSVFGGLLRVLDEPLKSFPPPNPSVFDQPYRHLLERAVGDIRLKEFEISNLSRDIGDWTNSIRKSVINRYLAKPAR
jgi:hypothetical protein